MKGRKQLQKSPQPIGNNNVGHSTVNTTPLSLQPHHLKFSIFFTLGTVFTLHALHAWYGGDPLIVDYINGPYVSIDSWSIVHVVTFFFAGLLAPEKTIEWMIYGCVWEVIEILLSGVTKQPEFWQEASVNTMWDIWFNFMGYRIGELVFYIKQG